MWPYGSKGRPLSISWISNFPTSALAQCVSLKHLKLKTTFLYQRYSAMPECQLETLEICPPLDYMVLTIYPLSRHPLLFLHLRKCTFGGEMEQEGQTDACQTMLQMIAKSLEHLSFRMGTAGAY